MKNINAVLDKSKYIISEEGFSIFIDRLIRVTIVKTRRLFKNDQKNIQRWRLLKDQFKDKRVFLIGNGPSLNKTPLHLLKHEYTMCFNRFNLMFERLDWLPTFYCNIDDRVLLDMKDEINGIIGESFQYIFMPDIHPYNINFKKIIENNDKIYWLYLEKLPFTQKLPYCGINKTVASVGLQILAYMGFNPIYLIGMDLDYKDHISAHKNNSRNRTSTSDDDPNHFDPRYFGQGRGYHHPRLEETFVRLKEGKEFFDKRGVKIFNATIGGKLEVFPRKEFRSLFTIDKNNEFDIFKENIIRKISDEINLDQNARSIESLILSKKVFQSTEIDFPSQSDFIILEAEKALHSINELIFKYIPFGPIEGKYLFVNRAIINK